MVVIDISFMSQMETEDANTYEVPAFDHTPSAMQAPFY